MPISDAQKRATVKYMKNNYDRIELKVTKGKKADLQVHAQERGESLNSFVNRAIDEAVERDSSGVASTTPIIENKAVKREDSDDE